MLRKICNFLTVVLIIILAMLAIVLIAPKLLGYQSLAVLSGSMEPEIPVGSLVLAKEVDVTELESGDVITYRLTGNTLVTHRIVEKNAEEAQLITKGDANDAPDAAPVAFGNVIGEVKMHFPYLGYLTMYIRTPLGIAGACAVLIVLILLTFLPEVFTPEDEKKEKDK